MTTPTPLQGEPSDAQVFAIWEAACMSSPECNELIRIKSAGPVVRAILTAAKLLATSGPAALAQPSDEFLDLMAKARRLVNEIDSAGTHSFVGMRDSFWSSASALRDLVEGASPSAPVAQPSAEPEPMTKEWCRDYPGAAAYIVNKLAREVDALRAGLLEQPSNAWVSVKDRLPLAGHGYVHNLLVVNAFGARDVATWDGYAQYFENDGHVLGGHEVTHWMPLPTPPTGAGEPTEPSADDSFWLIERGPNQGQSPHCWWKGDEPTIGAGWRLGEWVYDATKATRFTTKEAAEKVAGKEHRAGSYAITNHGLIESPVRMNSDTGMWEGPEEYPEEVEVLGILHDDPDVVADKVLEVVARICDERDQALRKLRDALAGAGEQPSEAPK